MSEINRNDREQHPIAEKSPAITGWISALGRGFVRGLGAIVDVLDPELIPVELQDILTMREVKEAKEIYWGSVRKDPPPSGRAARLTGINDSNLRKMLNIFAMHYSVHLEEMDQTQQTKMKAYCMKLMRYSGTAEM